MDGKKLKNKFEYETGKHLGYEIIGKGKEIIVFNSGILSLSKFVFLFLNELKKHYKILVYNYPGINDSTGKIKKINEITEIVQKLLKKLKIKKPTIIGYSGGCLIALSLTEKINVKRLILISPVIPSKKTTIISLKRFIKSLIKSKLNTDRFIFFLGDAGRTEKYTKEKIEEISKDFKEKGVLKILYFSTKFGKYKIKKEKIPKKTFVLIGKKDKLISINELKKMKIFKNIYIKNEWGHSFLTEHPKKATKQVLELLKK